MTGYDVLTVAGVGDVHMWRTRLDMASSTVSNLSCDEQERANRFKTIQLAHRFRVGRSFLRRVLSAYLQCHSKDIEFIYNGFGKPALAHSQIHFNVSHCGDSYLLAVAKTPVGVDIESINPANDLNCLAPYFMSPSELVIFDTVPNAYRAAAFFSLWAAKESFIKAVGAGFAIEPTTVELGWGAPTTIQSERVKYRVVPYSYEPGVCAAVTLTGEPENASAASVEPTGFKWWTDVEP